jgi:biotin transporter BioY
MWNADTLWFDVAVVMSIFAVGSVLFGRFEEHKPRARRLLKVVIVLTVTVGLSATVGRIWAYSVLAIPLVAAAYVHLVWLPQRGVSGWTAEPRDKYLELINARRR